MTMRSTVFKPGGLKLDRDLNPEKPDFEKAQSGGCAAAPGAGITIQREAGEQVLEPGHGGGLPAVLGNIHNGANQHQHHHNKNRKLKENNGNKNKTGSGNPAGAAGLSKAQGGCLGLGQGRTWLSLEGIHNNVFITGPAASNIKTVTGTPVNTTANAKKSSREPGGPEAAAGGAGSLELNMESKWKNVKKRPTQATCLRQILLLQLDLIEQQQQQLQTKDKEIDELKSEKETNLDDSVFLKRHAKLELDEKRRKSSLVFILYELDKTLTFEDPARPVRGDVTAGVGRPVEAPSGQDKRHFVQRGHAHNQTEPDLPSTTRSNTGLGSAMPTLMPCRGSSLRLVDGLGIRETRTTPRLPQSDSTGPSLSSAISPPPLTRGQKHPDWPAGTAHLR
ncbi:UNVERIFIED_CONTAM: hypothetical protein FKN15_010077 [Acipenser sinensis]